MALTVGAITCWELSAAATAGRQASYNPMTSGAESCQLGPAEQRACTPGGSSRPAGQQLRLQLSEAGALFSAGITVAVDTHAVTHSRAGLTRLLAEDESPAVEGDLTAGGVGGHIRDCSSMKQHTKWYLCRIV